MNSRPLLQPLAFAGTAFALSLLAASFLSVPALVLCAAVLAAACIAGAFFALRGKLRSRLFLLLLTISAALAVSAAGRFAMLDTAGYAGREVFVHGYIRDLREGDTASYLVETEGGDLPDGTRLLLYAGSAAEYGEGERFSGTISLSEDPPTRSQLARGASIVGFASGEEMRLTARASLPHRIAARISGEIRYTFARYFSPDSAAFLTALFFGDQSELPASLEGAFSILGISHILSVSGLHIGILTNLCLLLFSRLFGRGKLSFFLCAVLTGGFVLLTGAGAAAIRAWVMSIFSLSAFALCRDSSPGNALGGAMLLICVLNPSAALGTGFWMSVSATFGMFSAAPAMSRWVMGKLPREGLRRSRLLRAAISGGCVTIAANLFCLPVYFLWFGSLPWNSLLPNLLLVPLMPAILGGSWLILLPIPGRALLARALDLVLQGCFFLLENMAAVSGSLPLASGWFLAWGMGMLAAVFLIRHFHGKSRHIALGVSFGVFLLVTGGAVSALTGRERLSVSLVSYGEGGSAVLSLGSRAVVIGCGGNDRVGEKTAAFLRASGVAALDAIVAPAETQRLMGGMPALAAEFPPAQVYSGNTRNWYRTLADHTDAEMLPLLPGRYSLWGEGTLIISNSREYPDIGVSCGGARILFQSSRLPAPEGGWDLVIFYDEIPEKDGIPPRWYDIIETMRLPFSPHWLAGQPLFGESFAADIRYFFR